MPIQSSLRPTPAPEATAPPITAFTWRAVVVAYAFTAVHHVYGGLAFGTPERLAMALAFTLLFGLTLALYRSSGRTARLALRAIVLLFWVGLLGGFEGGYNHLYASIRFLAGDPVSNYPADLFFQATGILTFAASAAAAVGLVRRGREAVRAGRRRTQGERIAPMAAATLGGGTFAVPRSDGLVHLQFRRFAGCPLCDLHLRSFARRLPEIEAAGIRELVFFHSPTVELMRYAAHLPFATVADPGRLHYAAFGVETGLRALLDPRVWGAIALGLGRTAAHMLLKRAPMPPLFPEGGRTTLPADFLVGPDGRILACRYGAHAYDQWSVDELLTLAARHRPSTAQPPDAK